MVYFSQATFLAFQIKKSAVFFAHLCTDLNALEKCETQLSLFYCWGNRGTAEGNGKVQSHGEPAAEMQLAATTPATQLTHCE